MDEGFYRAFEDRHRGSRDLILRRLQAYTPFTLPYVQAQDTAAPKALDVGCGRGEWLELLQSQGFCVQGVDLDAGMLAACTELQLPAIQGDGLAYIAEQADHSWQVISAFHLVEHIDFEQVYSLVKEALRVLSPGGLLVLETPNPDNLIVAGRDFYLDPSHQKPIPAHLLAFVVEYAGFEQVKIVRLNESLHLHDPTHEVSLWDSLQGVSPDYAIVAQKGGSPALTQALQPAFAMEFGFNADQLMSRYDLAHQQRWQQQHQYNVSMQQQLQELEQQQQQQQQLIESVFQSKSWKVTAPLRAAMTGLRQIRSQGKPTVKKGLRYAMQFVLAKPALRNKLNQQLQRYPRLYTRLLGFAHGQGLIYVPAMGVNLQNKNRLVHLASGVQELSPRAHDAFHALTTALEMQKKGSK